MTLSVIFTLVPAALLVMLSAVMPVVDAPRWMLQNEDLNLLLAVLPPVLMAVIDIIVLLVTERTNKDQSEKIKSIIYLLMPIISFSASFFYASFAFGFSDNNEKLMLMLFSVMFIVIGNYLPKCRKNTTVGIKTKWALQNKHNWEATHRFCGRLWVAGGFLMFIFAFLPGNIGVYAFVIITLILAFIPFIYSYMFYRKQLEDGSYVNDGKSPKTSMGMQVFSGVVVAAIIIAVCVLMFAGSIEYRFRNHYLSVEASFFADMNLNYRDIEEMYLVDGKVGGSRLMGLGTARLACGAFRNDELGNFTSYRYVGCDNAIVIRTKDGETIVLSGKDEDATIKLYDDLLLRL